LMFFQNRIAELLDNFNRFAAFAARIFVNRHGL
jgi:hypothetical protein